MCFRKDQNVANAPAPRPTPSRIAFVTAAPLVMGAGGIADADALCTSEATAAGLTGVGVTFKAYLATTASAANTRFLVLPSKGGWYRVDGTPVFPDPTVINSSAGRPTSFSDSQSWWLSASDQVSPPHLPPSPHRGTLLK